MLSLQKSLPVVVHHGATDFAAIVAGEGNSSAIDCSITGRIKGAVATAKAGPPLLVLAELAVALVIEEHVNRLRGSGEASESTGARNPETTG